MWEDSTVNAGSSKIGLRWALYFFGGLARRPELTADAFALIVCHEMGHLVAGYPLYPFYRMSVEGQSDYFATQSCAKMIWQHEPEENAKFASFVPANLKTNCYANYFHQNDRNICYRTVAATLAMAKLQAYLATQRMGIEVVTSPDTPDLTEVDAIIEDYPPAQCRLDTSLAGAFCNKPLEPYLIPQTLEEQDEHLCSASRGEAFARPRCWFKQD
jgi:hypothetical protein